MEGLNLVGSVYVESVECFSQWNSLWEMWKEAGEDTGNAKWASGQTTFQSAPSSFTSSTSAGSKPGLFVFEKLFFIVLMKNRHGSNGKKIPQTDLWQEI